MFYNLYFFCTDLTKKMGIVAKCPISLKITPLKGKGCTSPSFSVQICGPLARVSLDSFLDSPMVYLCG